MKIKVKVFSREKEAIEIFLKEIEESYLSVVSKALPSSEGDWHGFATIEVSKK